MTYDIWFMVFLILNITPSHMRFQTRESIIRAQYLVQGIFSNPKRSNPQYPAPGSRHSTPQHAPGVVEIQVVGSRSFPRGLFMVITTLKPDPSNCQRHYTPSEQLGQMLPQSSCLKVCMSPKGARIKLISMNEWMNQ